MLDGEIKPGDARAVEALIRANIPFLWKLMFNSIGGSLDEAMQIGRVLRAYYLETSAPGLSDAPRAICASACFFAWLGGASRSGDMLGIHRPFPPPGEMQRLSPAEAERLYDDLSAKLGAYLAEMGASQHWLADMMKIRSDDLHMIPERQIREELENYERETFDLPSLAQWKLSKCGGLTTEEWDELQLVRQSNLSRDARARLNYLADKHVNTTQCGFEAVEEARWQRHGAPPITATSKQSGR